MNTATASPDPYTLPDTRTVVRKYHEQGIGADTATTLEQRQGFAVIQVGTCIDVAEGHQTWAGVRIDDMENGAQAAAMIAHLRTVFCPRVAP